MKQSAAEVPVHNYQRKAAIANGGVVDHAGAVQVKPIEGFDLDHTIFNTLEGVLPRLVIRTRIAKEVNWQTEASARVEAAYQNACGTKVLPEVDPELLNFLVEECDFEVEHADGSFLDHLYFCYEYSNYHYPDRSPLVMLLHSILGTGTNTFAMTADKMPALKGLMDEFEWAHVEAFPSILRLLYDLPLRQELWSNMERLDKLESIRFHRVIDNEQLTMTGEDFWIQLNYQLIHLVDFMPVANWSVHANDTSYIIFRDLYALLQASGHLAARIEYAPPSGSEQVEGEERGLAARLVTFIPIKTSEKMAAKSVRNFSERIDHSMNYEITWRS